MGISCEKIGRERSSRSVFGIYYLLLLLCRQVPVLVRRDTRNVYFTICTCVTIGFPLPCHGYNITQSSCNIHRTQAMMCGVEHPHCVLYCFCIVNLQHSKVYQYRLPTICCFLLIHISIYSYRALQNVHYADRSQLIIDRSAANSASTVPKKC